MCVCAAYSKEFIGEVWTAPDIMLGYLSRFPGFFVISLLFFLINISPVIMMGLFRLPLINHLVEQYFFIVLIMLGLFMLPLTIYFTIMLSISDVVYIVERIGIMGALNRSRSLIRGKLSYICSRLIVFIMVISIIQFVAVNFIIELPLQIISNSSNLSPTSPPLNTLFFIARSLINFYCQSAIICFSFMIFTSLVFMKEKTKVEKSGETKKDIDYLKNINSP